MEVIQLTVKRLFKAHQEGCFYFPIKSGSNVYPFGIKSFQHNQCVLSIVRMSQPSVDYVKQFFNVTSFYYSSWHESTIQTVLSITQKTDRVSVLFWSSNPESLTHLHVCLV